jgi:hypothetical protein
MIFDRDLTVSISLDQQPWNHGKSNFWPKFCIQPPETQKNTKLGTIFFLPNKILSARALKFHSSKIFKVL